MEGVLNWMKGIVIFFVISNVLLYLVQGKIYEKYIAFFMRLLVIIVVISPIAALICSEDEFLDSIAYTQFWQELEGIQKDSKRIGYANQEYCREEYEKLVEDDVLHLLERESYQSAYVNVKLTEAYEIEKMQIGIDGKQEGQSDSTAQEMMETIRVEEITVGKGGGKECEDCREADSPGENVSDERSGEDSTTENRYRKLKETIMEYYQIDGNQIVIEEVTS